MPSSSILASRLGSPVQGHSLAEHRYRLQSPYNELDEAVASVESVRTYWFADERNRRPMAIAPPFGFRRSPLRPLRHGGPREAVAPGLADQEPRTPCRSAFQRSAP